MSFVSLHSDHHNDHHHHDDDRSLFLSWLPILTAGETIIYDFEAILFAADNLHASSVNGMLESGANPLFFSFSSLSFESDPSCG
jgi:hypothetical protein